MIFVEAAANVVWVAAILYVFVNEVLQVSETWWGYINTAFFLGLILSGAVSSRFSTIIEKYLRRIVLCSSFGVAALTLLFGFNLFAWAALLLVALNGFADQMKGISIQTYLQKEASAEELPKIYGAQYAMVSLVFGVSTLVFGGLAEYFNVKIVFFIAGLLLAGSWIYALAVKERFPVKYIDVEK